MISRRMSASSTDAEWQAFEAEARALMPAEAYCLRHAAFYPLSLMECPECTGQIGQITVKRAGYVVQTWQFIERGRL